MNRRLWTGPYDLAIRLRQGNKAHLCARKGADGPLRFGVGWLGLVFFVLFVSLRAPALAQDLQIAGKIAFASTRDGNSEIYVMNGDGTGQTRLTNNAGSDDEPALSPDGTRIVFQSNRDGNWEVYVMNTDGTGQMRLTNNADMDVEPNWSPDGSQIVFSSTRDGNFEIYKMNTDGTGQTRLTNTGLHDQAPKWSPDGSKIVYYLGNGSRDIYVMNADGTGQTQITTNPNFDDTPAWSPDGSKIVFQTNRDGNTQLYVMNADGSSQTRLTNNSATDNGASWEESIRRIGSTPAGTPVSRTMTIENKGSATLMVSNITSSDGQFTVNPTNFSVNAGASQNVTVTFTPTSTGTKYATLTITSNDTDAPTVKLTVNGTATALFTDVASSAGVADAGDGTGVAWGDYDSDGDLDLYLANNGTANRLYRNNNNGTFTEVGASAGVNDAGIGLGVSWGDYDNDGDLDLYLANEGQANRLFKNNGNTNRWLIVKLVGTAGNKDGIGARVTAVTGALRQRRDVDGGSGYASQPSLPVEFGFGGTATVDSLIVRWPNGTTQVQTSVSTNQTLTVTEPAVPAISFSSTSLSFGNVEKGQSVQQTFTVSNTGAAALTVSSISASGTDAPQFTVNPTTFTINAGGPAQTVTVTFAPSSVGSKSASLSVAHNATGSPSTISLTGNGTAAPPPPAPVISLSTASLTMDSTSVGATSQKTFTISNTGNASLSVTGITVTGPDSSQFTVSPTTATIAAGGSQAVTVTFTPSSAGPKSASLSVSHNAAGSPSSIPLSGVGAGLPSISLSATSLSFGDVQVGQSKALTFTVGNTGDAALTLSGIGIFGTDASQFTANPMTFTVNAGASAQTVTVTFTPSSTGTKSATLFVVHSAAGSPSRVSLTGNGTAAPPPPAPAISLSNTSLAMDSTGVRSSSQKTFRINNIGNASLSISGIAVTGPDSSQFRVSPTTATIAAWGNLTITVTFAPTSVGPKSASLSIAHNAAGSPSSVPLSGIGVGFPSISLSAISLTMDSTKVEATSRKSLTVSNTGDGVLSIAGITVTGTDADQFRVSPTTATVAAGKSLTITVTFTPSSVGPKSASLSVAHNAAGSPATVALSGAGIAQEGPGVITAFGGKGDRDFSGDGGPANQASLNAPAGIVVDAKGSVYIADSGNHRIRRVGTDGLIATFAGSGRRGFSGDGGPAAQANLWSPTGVALDAVEAVYIADYINHRIRRVSPTEVRSPSIKLSASSLVFDTSKVGAVSRKTFTVSNVGSGSLSVTAITVEGRDTLQFTVSPTSFTLDVGAPPQTVTVTFTPSSAGSKSATLSVAHNAVGSPSTVSLTSARVLSTPDFNGDGEVDFNDFFLFLNTFGSKDAQFDLNGDGDVGLNDFSIFVEAFGK